MNKLAIALLAVVFALSINLTNAQEKKGTVPPPPNTLTAKAEVTKGTGKPVNTVCIVSGEEVDGKTLADYKGKTYSFCCKTCLKKFTKDPEKYVAKFEKSQSKTKTIN
jgi:YHS domain-containing protein